MADQNPRWRKVVLEILASEKHCSTECNDCINSEVKDG